MPKQDFGETSTSPSVLRPSGSKDSVESLSRAVRRGIFPKECSPVLSDLFVAKDIIIRYIVGQHSVCHEYPPRQSRISRHLLEFQTRTEVHLKEGSLSASGSANRRRHASDRMVKEACRHEP